MNLINIRENGPLAIRAEIILDEKPFGYRATLCRCGASKNKPFCDNSHHDLPFTASGEPATIDTPALAARDGPVQVEPQPNGPLRIRGNMEICSGTGRTVKRSTAKRLCRCGQSANKPYCDGSHKRVGIRRALRPLLLGQLHHHFSGVGAGEQADQAQSAPARCPA